MQTTAEIIKKHRIKNIDEETQRLIDALLIHSQKLEFRVNYLERYHLGKRSEKFIDPNQPNLGFDEVESYEEEIDESPEETASVSSTATPIKKRRPQLEIPTSVERVEILHEIPEEYRKNEVLQARIEESKVYLEKIKDLVESKMATLAESTPSYKAIKYMLSNWEKLTLYTKHPRFNISNHPAEQCIRPFAVGRKAWLFSNTTRGAEASAIIYSIVETAKMNQKIPGEVIGSLLKAIPHESPSKLLEIITSSTST